MHNILVTGGAGYIGSHTCLALSREGFTPIVLDNLTNGHLEFVRWGPFEKGDVRDRRRLDEIFLAYRPAAIIHFAGLIEVSDSISNPIAFFDNNISGSLTLLAAALSAGVDALVFSSTCATYGIPAHTPMSESHPQLPISPYGRSKLIVEQILAELSKYKEFRSVCLRYFNAAGAEPKNALGEWHDPETHVIPLAIEAAKGMRSHFKIFGSDYPTSDGTCIRDYVHVMDLADAHVRAVKYLLSGGKSISLNLGTGKGTSVKELIEAVESVSGKPLPIERALRRDGDPPELVADNSVAGKILGWSPQHDFKSIIDSAWQWHSRA
ncbi:UDP-glucose 4-epimerase GalE [Bradyrhizobium lablabi]|nr:UDP-glucose 4-epimerase GalE [Bradyrhizobium lablabi]SHM84599.1 UDP-galactose 4-epimerase [Bradyrhizobium lablabi]